MAQSVIYYSHYFMNICFILATRYLMKIAIIPIIIGHCFEMHSIIFKPILLTITLLVAFGLSGCSYNSLTAEQQQVKGAWADVESQLQRRADLVPNMIRTAQMVGVQEQEVFGQIAEARSRLLGASSAAPANDKTPEQRQAVMDAANSFFKNGYVPNRLASSRMPPSRSWMSARCTMAWSSKPSVSTRMWRFLPLIFLPAS